MNTSIFKRAAIAALILTGFASAARATTLGYGTSSAGYALWDTFATTSFSNQAANSSDTTNFSSTLSSTSSGMVLGGGDRLYSAGTAFSFSIAGTATTSLSSFTLQLKFTAPSVGTVADAFTISSSFGTASQFILGTSVEGSNTFNIVAWTWTGLTTTASTPFNIQITSVADHISLDGVRVDAGTVSAVPEPSSYAVIFGAMALGGALVRRRDLRKAA